MHKSSWNKGLPKPLRRFNVHWDFYQEEEWERGENKLEMWGVKVY